MRGTTARVVMIVMAIIAKIGVSASGLHKSWMDRNASCEKGKNHGKYE